jgi:hypothetical protein
MEPRLRPLSLILLVSQPAQLAAQTPTHISPIGATVDLGQNQNLIPFAWTPTAYQQVHHRDSFSSKAPALITRLRFRLGRGYRNREGRWIDVQISMAASPNDNTTATALFANNVVPGTEVQVFTRKLVSLPNVPDNSWAIAPFAFDVPFQFTGATHLSWRAIVWGNDNNDATFLYPLDMWSFSGTSTTNGLFAGCRSANGAANAIHTASVFRPGQVSTFDANSYVAGRNLPTLLVIGTSGTAWGSVPLPLDLAALGAPGCFLRNDILLTVPGTTSNDLYGAVSVQVAVPFRPDLFGAPVFTQVLFFEAAANSLGVFTSNGLAHTLGRNHGVARIFASGNPFATSGALDRYQALAIGLD